jgi:uncharacterized protein
MEIIGYLASAVMGISLGLTGGGGSILAVPILVYLFRYTPVDATTDSLFIVGTTAMAGALVRAKAGLVDWKSAIKFFLPSFLGVFFVRHFVLKAMPSILFVVSDFQVTKSLAIMVLFAAVMLIAARSMIRSGLKISPVPEVNADQKTSGLDIIYLLRAFLIGSLTGFVGAGGGFLIIPALVILFRLSMSLAIGTSLAVIAANSLLGFAISYDPTHHLNWGRLGLITLLGIVGLYVGQAISKNISESRLKVGFGVFVLVVGAGIMTHQLYGMFYFTN